MKNTALVQRQTVFAFVFALVLATTGSLIAWVGPTQSPPSGNVDAPINIGATPQAKAGGLGVTDMIADRFCFGSDCIASWSEVGGGTWSDGGGNTYLTSGNLGIGTTSPSFPLSVFGKIYTTGGIRFPDGTEQTSAVSSSGDVSCTTYDLKSSSFTLATVPALLYVNAVIHPTAVPNADYSYKVNILKNAVNIGGLYFASPGDVDGTGDGKKSLTTVIYVPNGTGNISYTAAADWPADWDVTLDSLSVTACTPTAASGGGISGVTTATCSYYWGYCTATCPSEYYRTGCAVAPGSGENIAYPSGTNSCTCGGGDASSGTGYAICAH